MAFESQVMKKQQKKLSDGVFGDVYGATAMLLPKDLDLEKPISSPFELRLQSPDFGRAFGVTPFFWLLFLNERNFVLLVWLSVWLPRKKKRKEKR